MSATLAIARRELGAMLRLPVGWITAALFCALTALVFAGGTLTPGGPASMRPFFALASWMLIPIAPAISMRLVSEELRTQSLELLRTAPLGDAALVWGKYLGALAFLVLAMVPTLAFPAVLYVLSGDVKPDWGPIVGGYLGLTLVGALYLSIGLLFSTMTSSQTLAFLGTMILLAAVMLVSTEATPRLPAEFRRAAQSLLIPNRLADFSRGVIDLSHVVFFLSGSLLFVTLACVSMASRRWR